MRSIEQVEQRRAGRKNEEKNVVHEFLSFAFATGLPGIDITYTHVRPNSFSDGSVLVRDGGAAR
jgi:hypothetical protein